MTDPEYLAQAEARSVLPNHLDAEAWSALAMRDIGDLRSRWETTPWPLSGG